MTKSGSIRYPRGFVRADLQNYTNTFVDGDAELNVLYDLFITGKVNHQGWAFRCNVLACAVRLFGNLHKFAQLQVGNPLVHGYNYEFLLDTLNYLKTGRRKLSLQAWEGLISEHKQGTSEWTKRAPIRTTQEPFQTYGTTAADLISVWCAKPQGFEDLLKTMFLLFGRTFDVRNAPPALKPLLG